MQNAHMRVDGASPRGLWPPVGGGLCRRVVKEKVLRIDRPAAGGFLSLTAFQAEGGGGGFAADYKKASPPPPVISTEAKRSGEIFPSDGTGGIEVGDLSTQSIIKAFSICPIPTCSSARDDGVGEQHTVISEGDE